jgi:hypothetical protein
MVKERERERDAGRGMNEWARIQGEATAAAGI